MLAVAYEQFSRHGYDGVSMEDLARAAGITKPMLYAYFGSKEGLYTACVERMVGPMLEYVRREVEPQSAPDRRLWAGIVAQLGFIDEHRREWRAFVWGAIARGGPAGAALAQGRRQVTSLLGELLESSYHAAGREPPAADELDAAAHALQGAVEQVAAWWEEHPEQSRDAVALRLMNFMWQGLGNLLEQQVWLPPEAEG